MKNLILSTLLLIIISKSFSQTTQVISGSVLDKYSNLPIPFASIKLEETNPKLTAVTDGLGNFSVLIVPVGRYNIQVSCSGYESTIIREIIVGSAKQTYLSIFLKQTSSQLNEVVVKQQTNKQQPLNSMATVSARMLSVEEAKRYAGGFDDPARLASSFAGVASNSGVNGIIVRGNAPKFLQWKMEGIEIPNPNHFGDLLTYGGGIFSALSSQMLANSDFMTGAFPAEYNNALSGVFDLGLRKGNNQKRENTISVGLVGLENSSEGPFKKGGKSSYLYNFRSSTFALLKPLLPEGASELNFQDLSFKLNFPTDNFGTFSIWGIGLKNGVKSKAKTDKTKWEYDDDKQNNEIKLYMGATGVGHKIFFRNNSFLKTTLAATTNTVDWNTESLDNQLIAQPESNISYKNSNFVFSSILNTPLNEKHTNRSGILLTGMSYDLKLNKSGAIGLPLTEIANSNGFSSLLSAFSNSSIKASEKLIFNLGVNAQIFTLNNKYTIEPRIGARYLFKQNQTIGFAYGLHSRLEQLNFYFNNSLTTSEKAINKNLDFSKAHHLVLSYDWNISDLVHLKIEPYYQQLFSIPVVGNTSFSTLNLETDWFFAQKLENTGKGQNYGIDFTLEKYMSRGYYYMFTASVFNSEYKGGDNVWRNTRFNRNYVFNFLFGKEWYVGTLKQNVWGLNTKISYQGGNRFSPINTFASNQSQDVVFDENNAYNSQMNSLLNVHFTASYRMNKKKTAQEFALKIININGQPDFNGFKYNLINNQVDKDLATVIIPNLSYKIEF